METVREMVRRKNQAGRWVRTRSSTSAAPVRAAAAASANGTTSNPETVPVMSLASATATASSLFSTRDLVPFVSFLQTNQDALQQQFQQEREDRLRVELKGPAGGDPLHCATSMKRGYTDKGDHNIPHWVVRFHHSFDGVNNVVRDSKYPDNIYTLIPNFLETVTGLEVRVGGVVIMKVRAATVVLSAADETGFDRTHDEEPQMGIVTFVNADGVSLMGRVGPIIFENYVALPRNITVFGLVRFWTEHSTTNNNTDATVVLPQLQLLAVSFLQSQIPGLRPFLEEDTTTTTGRNPSTTSELSRIRRENYRLRMGH